MDLKPAKSDIPPNPHMIASHSDITVTGAELEKLVNNNYVEEIDMAYIDRGDPPSWDYSKTDFTTDGQWHTLNLRSIVPEGASLVHLRVGGCYSLCQ